MLFTLDFWVKNTIYVIMGVRRSSGQTLDAKNTSLMRIYLSNNLIG